ncbi:MAG: hypothetical protein ACRDTP_09420 [Mycobacteriales bacterium]
MLRRLRGTLAAARPPADVRAVVPPGEQLLSWGYDTGGDPLVATTHGLWGYGERLAWVEIDHVSLAEDVLTIRGIDGEDREVPLREARDLPAVVKAQVEGSVLHARRVPLLPDGRGVTVVARRSGEDIDWRLQFDVGLEPDDALWDKAERARDSIRAELGA